LHPARRPSIDQTDDALKNSLLQQCTSDSWTRANACVRTCTFFFFRIVSESFIFGMFRDFTLSSSNSVSAYAEGFCPQDSVFLSELLGKRNTPLPVADTWAKRQRGSRISQVASRREGLRGANFSIVGSGVKKLTVT
jgi:hypothetical protein